MGPYSPEIEKLAAATDYVEAWAPDHPSALAFYHPPSGRRFAIELPFFAHSFVQSPLAPRYGLAVGRWTTGAALIDLRERRLAREIKAPAGNRFFGHAIYSPTSARVVISGNTNDQRRGRLFVYDTQDYALAGVVSSGGIFPHEIVWTGTPDVLAVANSHSIDHLHEPGSLTLVNLRPARTVSAFELPFATHLLAMENGTFMVASKSSPVAAPFLAAVHPPTLLRHVMNLEGWDLPPGGEALSLCRIGQWVGVTTGAANHIVTFQPGTRALLGHKLPGAACGMVSVGPEIFVNSWNPEGTLARMSFDPLNGALNMHATLKSFSNGSHLSAVTLPGSWTGDLV